jgi:murein DD-endopeptidase MepM/ murein hydrolase activator NlpD
MPRIKVYKDSETFEYVRVKLTPAQKLARMVLYGALGGMVALGTQNFWSDWEEKWALRNQNEASRHLVAALKELQKVEKETDKIFHNDQTFYRSLLNITPMDKSTWEGGKGGAGKSYAGEPLVMAEMRNIEDRLRHKFRLQRESFERIGKLASAKSEELKHLPAARPMEGRIVSGYGYRRDPFHGHIHFHAGIDVVAPVGTKIKAVGDGTVITSGYTEQGYGLQIEINHGYGYVTKYAHLSQSNVKVGQKVKRGDVIGLTGNTGYSTGPHLHYEVIKNGVKVNPYDYYYLD